MQGNVYIALNTETYNSKIPNELVARYGYTETDEEGNSTEVHPTWAELGERNKQRYGSVIKVKVGLRNIYVVELTASWLNGETSALKALGEGLDYPQNSLLTAEEAQELIKNNSDNV